MKIEKRWEINSVPRICPKCGIARLYLIEKFESLVHEGKEAIIDDEFTERLWLCMQCRWIFERKDL